MKFIKIFKNKFTSVYSYPLLVKRKTFVLFSCIRSIKVESPVSGTTYSSKFSTVDFFKSPLP